MRVVCDNEEETEINPSWYQNNGTPVCPECDCDMDYSRTEIDEDDNSAADSEALDDLQELMSGKEWDSDTLGEVAEIIRGSGRIIRDYSDPTFEPTLE